jgi:hypothetical protein
VKSLVDVAELARLDPRLLTLGFSDDIQATVHGLEQARAVNLRDVTQYDRLDLAAGGVPMLRVEFEDARDPVHDNPRRSCGYGIHMDLYDLRRRLADIPELRDVAPGSLPSESLSRNRDAGFVAAALTGVGAGCIVSVAYALYVFRGSG